MDIDKIMKDYLKQQARFRDVSELPPTARRFLEEEEKRRKLQEPYFNIAKRLHESQLQSDNLIKKALGDQKISDFLKSNELTWGPASKTIMDALDRLNEQSFATKHALDSITENIIRNHSLETHLRLPRIETLLANDLFARYDVESFSVSSDQITYAIHQDIKEFIGYTEDSSDEEIIQYFSKLTHPAQLTILWFINHVIVPIVITLLTSYYYDSGHLQEILDNRSISSSREVKQAVKNIPSDIDLSYYAEYRVVTGDGLRLREGPGMKSIVIDKIPRGKLVKVLERGRTWTKVEVDFQESEIPLVGWVYSRYLTQLKR